MKRFYLLICALFCMNAFAQDLFKFEKTLEGQFTFNSALEAGSYTNLSTPAQANVFYGNEIQGNSVVYKTYDTDYNLTKETFTFDIPSGYTISSCTRIQLANTNTSDLFIVVMRGMNSGETDYNRAIIYDEYGKNVFEFKSSNASISVYPMLYKIDGKYKLLVWRMDLENNVLVYNTDIYVLNIAGIESGIAEVDAPIAMSQVYNIRGERVGEVVENQLNQLSLPQGVYILKKEGNMTKKIFVE